MLLENWDTELDARTLQLLFGLGLGVVLGIAAQISRFCLRRALAGDRYERGEAAAVWFTAFATAIPAFQIAAALGYVNIEGHCFLAPDMPILAILAGGFAFGVGMVLTRGCASRLTVLSATGNLRAATVLIVFAVTAHAMLKGVLSPIRTTLGSVTVNLPTPSLADIPGGQFIGSALAILLAAWLIHRYRPTTLNVVLGAVIGLTAVAGWVITSVLLMDDFDPLPIQSVAFTLPWTDTLFWFIASTSIPAGFGTGLVGGVFLGSFLSALTRGELGYASFESPSQTLRYSLGAILMGMGGVLAGGCSVGAGLSGSATLSLAALLALAAIIAGAAATGRVLNPAKTAIA